MAKRRYGTKLGACKDCRSQWCYRCGAYFTGANTCPECARRDWLNAHRDGYYPANIHNDHALNAYDKACPNGPELSWPKGICAALIDGERMIEEGF